MATTAVGRRKALVDQFQRDDGPPFFVLSLKAGGTGLNLTTASHVIHFDRWWNPAVENQATDRAYRIGQRRNVLVHKFVCRGTVEEKIDALIEEKTQLAADLLEGGAEKILTEMSDCRIDPFRVARRGRRRDGRFPLTPSSHDSRKGIISWHGITIGNLMFPWPNAAAGQCGRWSRCAKKGSMSSRSQIDGRKIARTFWGEAWCDHLEAFSDFANRLPRGRTYVRNGSVCHLAVSKGQVEAKVSGSELYTVKVNIKPLAGQEVEGDQRARVAARSARCWSCSRAGCRIRSWKW